MTAYIGIDPGAHGAIAYVFHAHDSVLWNGEEFAKHTPLEWFELLKFIKNTHGAFAMIEKVGAMPRQGVSSTFKFGYQAGMCEAMVLAAGIPYEFVTPQKWQKAMKCLSHGNKNVTKRAAQALFPGPLRITHGNADALLIAEYARRAHNG
jgi:crossover junction endodeoxyribonuclease RuvC